MKPCVLGTQTGGRLLLAAALAASLGGCVSLFPKEKPVQLYRFEHAAAPATATSAVAAAASFTLKARVSGFDPAAASDRILSSTGDDTAYIAQARWVTPAVSLFDAALTRAFETQPGPASLLGPGEFAAADKRLFVDVETFEVRMDKARGAPPHVVVVVSAALEASGAAATRQERIFRADVPADANAMSAIIPAFDRAVTSVLDDVVSWVDRSSS